MRNENRRKVEQSSNSNGDVMDKRQTEEETGRRNITPAGFQLQTQTLRFNSCPFIFILKLQKLINFTNKSNVNGTNGRWSGWTHDVCRNTGG